MSTGKVRETGRCQWCARERPVDLMRKWNNQWQCQDWQRCANVARKRRD